MVTMNGDRPTTCLDQGEDLRRRVEQLERQLAAAEQRQLAFAEGSSEVVALLDARGTICAISPAVERILGYAPATCLGTPFYPLLHPEDQPRIVSLLESLALAPGASASVQVRMRHQNGQWCWVEATAKNQLHIPAAAGIVLNFHDVTALHRAEEQIQADRELWDAVMSASTTAMVVLSAAGQLVFASERAELLLGPSLAADACPPSDPPAQPASDLARALRQVLDRGEPTPDIHHTIRLPNGEQRVLSLNGIPVRAAAGQIAYVVFSIADITEQQIFAQQLIRRQQMEAVGRLAGGVAHDFNNALTVILGACSFMMDEVAQHPALRHDLEQIQEAGERVSMLTRQLLALSRQQALMLQPIQLNTSIERLRLMLQRMLGRQIELRLQLAPALGLITADAHQIDLALVNLAAHALDSMPQGGTVLIETAEVELDAACVPGHTLAPGRYAMLAVSDTGGGIDMAAREQIFDPFRAARRPGTSTGLVLSSVQSAVLQLDGAIWVDSHPGYGSTFKIFLPFATAGAAPQPTPPLPGLGRSVLVVDPNPHVLAFARAALSQAGYQAFGAELLDHARPREALDVLIIDVHTPELAAQVARLVAALPQLQVIYTSGHTRDALDLLAHPLPALPDLIKPFAAAALLSCVQARCLGDLGAA